MTPPSDGIMITLIGALASDYCAVVMCLWSQRVRSLSTRYLEISRWQFGADSSIILKFIALRVKARGHGPFVL